MKSTEGSQKANGWFLRCQQRNGSSRREYLAGSALLPSVVEALVLRDVGIKPQASRDSKGACLDSHPTDSF